MQTYIQFLEAGLIQMYNFWHDRGYNVLMVSVYVGGGHAGRKKAALAILAG